MEGRRVALARPGILHIVGIEYLCQCAVEGQADAVDRPVHRGEVGHAQHGLPCPVGADKAHHAVVLVVGIHPLEAVPAVVYLVEGRVLPVEMVQRPDTLLHLRVLVIHQQEPVQLVVIAPLDELAELTAHKQQLFAGMGHGVAIQRPQPREFLPQVAGLLFNHGALAMHHLVMGEGQHKMLGEGVKQREGQLVVVPLAVDGIQLDIAEGIVHPAHIPLEGETKAALAGRLCHHGIGVAFLGDGHGPGEIMPHGGVELLQEGDGIQVFPPAVGVGQPLLPLAAEVVIQHGADSVHPQAVRMEPVQPEAGVAQKERAHLAPPEVEHAGAPLGHLAPPGVGMLKAGRAVKAAQPRLVPGKMGRHPVKNHADARLMAPVDKGHQVVG